MKVTAALLASVVLGNRLLDPSVLAQGNINPFLFDGDKSDMAMYNYLQGHPDAQMNPWMMKEMDKEDWAIYSMLHGGQQGANAPGLRGQASPNAAAAGGQMNPAIMQALLRSDVAEDLMDSDLVQNMMMAKQMQAQQQAMHSRGKPQGFGDYAQFGSFGQTSTTPSSQFQYYPGMDEEMMQWQMMQQNPGSYNPMIMADWDIKDWTRYNMMNQQGSQNSNPAMWMDGDVSDYMMWQSLMNSQKPSSSRGNAIEQMQKMALCQTYLNSLNGDQAHQMQAYTLYAHAEDIGEDDIRNCLMMHQMQKASAAAAAPSTGFDFGSGFGPRTVPDVAKNIAMMAWMNQNQGQGQGPTYYPGMDAEDMLEFSFWQKMKEQVASKQQ